MRDQNSRNPFRPVIGLQKIEKKRKGTTWYTTVFHPINHRLHFGTPENAKSFRPTILNERVAVSGVGVKVTRDKGSLLKVFRNRNKEHREQSQFDWGVAVRDSGSGSGAPVIHWFRCRCFRSFDAYGCKGTIKSRFYARSTTRATSGPLSR